MARNRENSSQKGLLQLLRFRTTILILVILLVGFGAVAVRLFYLQLIQGPELQELAVDQQLVDTKLSAKRGTIYDCNGKILAQSASVLSTVSRPARSPADRASIVRLPVLVLMPFGTVSVAPSHRIRDAPVACPARYRIPSGSVRLSRTT